jgi:alpha,alpha-trehalase
MTREHEQQTGDKAFPKKVLPSLKREYAFWQSERQTASGLNRYSGQAYDDSAAVNMYHAASERLKKPLVGEKATVGRHYLAEAESGWDFCARFEGRCMDFNPVDLNCNLYLYETLLAEWSERFGEDGSAYRAAANARKAKINDLCWDGNGGGYYDYCYAEKRLGTYPSAAGFHPYFTGVAPKERTDGLKALLAKLERAHGISAGAPSDTAYQWGDPNVWAPLQYVAVQALKNYGLIEDAKRVAEKYLNTVRRNFEKTGKLYEKYNGDTGGNDAVSEYGTPEMLGWTAGVYLALLELVEIL